MFQINLSGKKINFLSRFIQQSIYITLQLCIRILPGEQKHIYSYLCVTKYKLI